MINYILSRFNFIPELVCCSCIPSSSNDKFNISKQRTKVALEVLNEYFEIFIIHFSRARNGNSTLKEKETML